MAEEEAKSSKSAVKRVRGVVIEKPIVVGSMAWALTKKDETSHLAIERELIRAQQNTHRWTIYVRSHANEDMSYFIKKVVFNLHPSFGDRAKRTVESAPYEIEDAGWGEFEAHIRIHFHDPAEKPIDLYALTRVIRPPDAASYHGLRLYPPEGQVVPPKKPVVSEYYDEIVFYDPTEATLKRLKTGGPMMGRSIYAEHFIVFNEEAELKKIKGAHKKVKNDIARLKEQFDSASAKIETPDIAKEEPAV